MGVHVDEIHTEVSSAAPAAEGGPTAGGSASAGGAAEGQPGGPGASEDSWRRTMARVAQLRCRVAAEGFDD